VNPVLTFDGVQVFHGDCVEVMRSLPDASVDSVVTDPPYGLEFMGKDWDAPWKGDVRQRGDSTFDAADESAPFGRVRHGGTRAYGTDSAVVGQAFQLWCTEWATEALRVLKPGGHLLAFGGTRTWHRLAVAIEDAGFEVRDSIAWMYGSGFPKSLDVSKAIDRKRDDTQDIHNVVRWLEARRQDAGVTRAQVEQHFGTQNIGQALFTITSGSASRVATWNQWLELKSLLGFGDDMDAEVWRLNGRKGQPGEAWAEREVVGERKQRANGEASAVPMNASAGSVELLTAPATPAAQQWQGWGTALKPAFEPIVVARKPLIGTVAENVLAHGTGGLNIDGCRIGTEQRVNAPARSLGNGINMSGGAAQQDYTSTVATGRWPANVILDESQAAELDKQSGVTRSKSGGIAGWQDEYVGGTYQPIERTGHEDTGGASRFFYCAKAPKKERPNVDGIAHPTVKPLRLMEYLVRLVTPPGGTVLEPFAGSGATIEAAVSQGFHVIAIEQEADYIRLIEARLNKPIQEAM
jgi:DNA modification methylase